MSPVGLTTQSEDLSAEAGRQTFTPSQENPMDPKDYYDICAEYTSNVDQDEAYFLNWWEVSA